jgi:hypothetical protein
MKKYLLISFLVITSHSLFAQSSYNQAIGLKFPGGFSVSYKKFVADTKNIEANATIWNQGLRVTGLYEFNFDLEGVEGLRWFVGPGAHIGVWNNKHKNEYNTNADLGIDGIIGLDYKFRDYPINLSLDWQPSITILGNTGFIPSLAGLGVRYTF